MNSVPLPRVESAANPNGAGTLADPPVFAPAAEYAAICNIVAKAVDRVGANDRTRLAYLAVRAATVQLRLYAGDDDAASRLRSLADEFAGPVG